MSSLRDTVPRVLGFLDAPCAVRLLETSWGIYDRLDAREWNLHFARRARLLEIQRWVRYASLRPKLRFARGHFPKRRARGPPIATGGSRRSSGVWSPPNENSAATDKPFCGNNCGAMFQPHMRSPATAEAAPFAAPLVGATRILLCATAAGCHGPQTPPACPTSRPSRRPSTSRSFGRYGVATSSRRVSGSSCSSTTGKGGAPSEAEWNSHIVSSARDGDGYRSSPSLWDLTETMTILTTLRRDGKQGDMLGKTAAPAVSVPPRPTFGGLRQARRFR